MRSSFIMFSLLSRQRPTGQTLRLAMSLQPDTDTIVAVATPPGRGGVCILRISGPRAFELAAGVAGTLPAPRCAKLRALRAASGEILDRGLVLVFPGPDSFTGEDVVELQIHGSPVLAALLLRALVSRGARAAGPGEFTRRAYTNGRMDLAQAEAVADLIESASAEAARAAMRSLEGEFSAQVNGLAEALVGLRVRLEAGLDFPEEGVDDYTDPELLARVAEVAGRLEALRQAAARGRVLRDGLTLVIAGAPNAGKSSLLNRLAGYEAAIVTELAGTTRDLVREDILIDGMPVRVVDTAGLRVAADRIEAEGIRRAQEAMAQADMLLLVRDGAAAPAPVPPESLPPGIPVLHVLNKIDLLGLAAGVASDAAGRTELRLSALTGAGVELLRAFLKERAGYSGEAGGAYSARRRHLDALASTARHLAAAHELLNSGATVELAAEELRLAHQALGEITGAFSTEDMLGRIFSEFCIGK
jgi:tRNA modification GTPase